MEKKWLALVLLFGVTAIVFFFGYLFYAPESASAEGIASAFKAV